MYGYFPKAAETWLVVNERSFAEAKTVFADPEVRISVDGRCELGAPVGTQTFVEAYVEKKVKEWVDAYMNSTTFVR